LHSVDQLPSKRIPNVFDSLSNFVCFLLVSLTLSFVVFCSCELFLVVLLLVLFLLFIRRRQISPGVYTLTPDQYVPLMKSLGVTCIVRFNDKCYDRKVFTNNGIRHVDLYYEDGGNPSDNILQSFLQLCESEKGAIAVHCKAGLGRTGTNIAAYMMKHYGYTAKETIAWCRICRPGCIVGPQQQYLLSIEARMFQEGAQFREKLKINVSPVMSSMTSKSASGSTTPSGVTDLEMSIGTGASSGGRTTPLIHQDKHANHHKTGWSVLSFFLSFLLSFFLVESIFKNGSASNTPVKQLQDDHTPYHSARSQSTGHPGRQSGNAHNNNSSDSKVPLVVITSSKPEKPHSHHHSSSENHGSNLNTANSSFIPIDRPISASLSFSKDSNDSMKSSGLGVGPGVGSSSLESSTNSFNAGKQSRPLYSSTDSAENKQYGHVAVPVLPISNGNSSPTISRNASNDRATTAGRSLSAMKTRSSQPLSSSQQQQPQWGMTQAVTSEEVRRSLQTQQKNRGSQEVDQIVPLTRKDSKLAWNDRGETIDFLFLSPFFLVFFSFLFLSLSLFLEVPVSNSSSFYSQKSVSQHPPSKSSLENNPYLSTIHGDSQKSRFSQPKSSYLQGGGSPYNPSNSGNGAHNSNMPLIDYHNHQQYSSSSPSSSYRPKSSHSLLTGTTTTRLSKAIATRV
jgi:protein-tyrosine phosphatase